MEEVSCLQTDILHIKVNCVLSFCSKMSCWKCVLQQTTVTEQQKKQMKSVLGILAKDIPLLEYWMKFSSDN